MSAQFIDLEQNSVFPKTKESRKRIIGDILNGIQDPISRNVRIPGMSGEYDVYEVSIFDLIYNFKNFRFYLERATYETQEDENFYIDESHRHESTLLTEKNIWKQSEEENEKTITSLLKDGQIDPGVCDLTGLVVSGNRRLMLLHQIKRRRDEGLYRNSKVSDSRLDELTKMRVAIDQKELSASEIFVMETKLQHNISKRLDYDRIAKYFIIENLSRNEHKSHEEIFADNRGMPSLTRVSDVAKFIRVAELMEEYLRFVKMPGILTELKGLEDPMRKLDDDILKIKKGDRIRSGNEDLLILEYRNAYFMSLWSNSSSIKSDKGVKEKWYRDMFDAFDISAKSWKKLVNQTHEFMGKIEPPSKVDSNTIKETKQTWVEENSKEIIDTLVDVSDDVNEHRKYNENPEKLLSRTINNLEQFDKMITSEDADFFLSGFKDVNDRVDEIRKILNSILNHLPTDDE